jgi:hypothetical protein
MIREETFDELEYPVDADDAGNQYPLPSNMQTQTHRQRAMLLNHTANADAFRRAAEVKNACAESRQTKRAEELRWRETELANNQLCEGSIHRYFGRDPNSSRDLFQQDETPVHMPMPPGCQVRAFVKVRCMTSRNDPNFIEPTKVGTVAAFLVYLKKLSANPIIQPTSDERTWIYLLLTCFKLPVIMSADEDALPPIEPVQVDEEVTSALSRTRVVSPVVGLIDDQERFRILDNPALVELAGRQFNCGSAVNTIVSIGVRRRTNILFPKAVQRFNDFRKIHLPQTNEFQYHWVMMALKDNLRVLCEIVALNRHVNENIAATNYKESLLQPHTSMYFRGIVEEGNAPNEHLHGILLYADTTRSSICHSIAVHGDQNNFSNQYKQDEKDSKKPSTAFSRVYPYSAPSNPTQGGWKARFNSLVPLVAIAFNPHAEHNCISERGNGLFQWSDATINKLQSCSVSGANSLKEKQTVFVLHMLQFTYELMMHQDACVPNRPFNLFMGRALNLHNGRNN